MQQAQKNYLELQKLVGDFETSLGNGRLFKSEGFFDLVLFVKERSEDKKTLLLHMSHVEHSKETNLLLNPWMEIEVNLVAQKVKVIHLNAGGLSRLLYSSSGSKDMFLSYWLENIRAQGFEKAEVLQCEVKPRQNERYLFDGKLLVTKGVSAFLSGGEIVFIDLFLRHQAEILEGIDYLQVFYIRGVKVWAIDSLSKEMKEGDGYSSKEIKENNYFTLLFPEEY